MTGGKDVKLSGIQLAFLLIGFLYGSTSILNPAGSAGRDNWLAVLAGGSIGSLLLLIYAWIATLNPNRTLIEILRDNFGRVIGGVLSVLYIWYFLHLAALVIRNFGEFMTTVSYPETPIVVIMSLFAVLVVYTVKSGLEVMGRISEILVPVVPLIVLAAETSLITLHDFSAFAPVLENGITPVLKAGFALTTFPFGESVAFMMVFPYLNKKEQTIKAAMISAVFVCILFLIATSRDLILLGPQLLRKINYVPDITTKLIPGISIEPFVDVNLLIGGGIKTSVCLYAAVKGMAELLRVENYRSMVSAFAVFALVLSVWLYIVPLEMIRWANEVWPYYSIPFQYGIPFLLLILSWLKRRKREESRQGSDG